MYSPLHLNQVFSAYNYVNITCLPPGMTEESRHIQLTNQINFVPALCSPSDMNAFMIFIQNNSLVDNHSTNYKRYIDMDD